MKKDNGRKLLYLPRLLAEIHRETGLTFFAACCGGSALFNVSNGAAYYAQLLAEVPPGVKYLIPVVCGNGFYNGLWNGSVGFAAADLTCRDGNCYRQVRLFVGGAGYGAQLGRWVL